MSSRAAFLSLLLHADVTALQRGEDGGHVAGPCLLVFVIRKVNLTMHCSVEIQRVADPEFILSKQADILAVGWAVQFCRLQERIA